MYMYHDLFYITQYQSLLVFHKSIFHDLGVLCFSQCIQTFNPLPHMPILDSSISAANKNIMSKIWTNEDTIF